MKRAKNRIIYILRYWFPILIYCLAIFVQSSFPMVTDLSRIPNADKLVHAAAYAVLAFLFFRAYRTLRFGHRRMLVCVLSVASAWFYGMADELHQVFVPSRTPDIWDALANGAGGLIAVVLAESLSRIATAEKRRIP